MKVLDGTGTAEERWRSWSRLGEFPLLHLGAAPRIVLVAPHPDDEVLALGGLLRLHPNCQIVAVTDGEASHPGHTALGPEALRGLRLQERAEALRRLGRPDLPVLRLKHPDGAVGEDLLRRQLTAQLRPGDVCVATWRGDGHPDHEAVGRAAAAAAQASTARLWEYPVWMWQWASPDDPRVPWHRARRLPLDPATAAAKRRAIQAYGSQVRALPPDSDRVILPPHVLERFHRHHEVVFVGAGTSAEAGR